MLYEFTVTLLPTLYRLNCKEQFRITKIIIRDLLSSFKTTIVAELTNDNNIHYHCIVELTDLDHRDKLLNKFRGSKYFGRKTCTQLINYEKYVNYLMKDLDRTRTLTHQFAIINDQFEIQQELDAFQKLLIEYNFNQILKDLP